jgi:hypothetical protein
MRATVGFLLLLHGAAVSAFAPVVVRHINNSERWCCDPSPRRRQLLRKMAAADDDGSANEDHDGAPRLLLTPDEIRRQMHSLRSQYPTSEAEYLAAARARNAAKLASSERTATDRDWHQMAADQKRDVGALDDWESSAEEAGNVDSQILIPMESNSGTGDDGEEEEPKLLLF